MVLHCFEQVAFIVLKKANARASSFCIGAQSRKQNLRCPQENVVTPADKARSLSSIWSSGGCASVLGMFCKAVDLSDFKRCQLRQSYSIFWGSRVPIYCVRRAWTAPGQHLGSTWTASSNGYVSVSLPVCRGAPAQDMLLGSEHVG